MTCMPYKHNYYACMYATRVQGYKHKNKYILTQGPLEHTSRDFWKMVYERNATCIVMLSGMIEDEEVRTMADSESVHCAKTNGWFFVYFTKD